jgi:hypothetical protein
MIRLRLRDSKKLETKVYESLQRRLHDKFLPKDQPAIDKEVRQILYNLEYTKHTLTYYDYEVHPTIRKKHQYDRIDDKEQVHSEVIANFYRPSLPLNRKSILVIGDVVEVEENTMNDSNDKVLQFQVRIYVPTTVDSIVNKIMAELVLRNKYIQPQMIQE